MGYLQDRISRRLALAAALSRLPAATIHLRPPGRSGGATQMQAGFDLPNASLKSEEQCKVGFASTTLVWTGSAHTGVLEHPFEWP